MRLEAPAAAVRAEAARGLAPIPRGAGAWGVGQDTAGRAVDDRHQCGHGANLQRNQQEGGGEEGRAGGQRQALAHDRVVRRGLVQVGRAGDQLRPDVRGLAPQLIGDEGGLLILLLMTPLRRVGGSCRWVHCHILRHERFMVICPNMATGCWTA